MFPNSSVLTRTLACLAIVAGLAFAAPALAQGGASGSGTTVARAAVITDISGTVTIERGTNPPRKAEVGEALLVGDIIRVNADSSAVLGYLDGQVTVLGARTAFRVARFVYDREQPRNSEVFLQLIDGSMRLIVGEIGERNPSAVRVQVGTATFAVAGQAEPERGTDAGIVIQGLATVASVTRGSATLTLSNGDSIRLGAGEGIYVRPDGTHVQGPLSQVQTQAAGNAQGKQLVGQLAIFESLPFPRMNRQTIILLATQSPFGDSAEPPGATLQEPPTLASGTLQTAAGASGGGTPCGASCN